MNGTAPRFTILCATYNQADYLEEMMLSALTQTHTDFELVVIDDGSTDRTPALLQELIERLPADQRSRIVTERTANGGQTAAYEHGFGLSRGQYICLLDSDDRFHPDKLSELEQVTRSHPQAGLIMHPLNMIGPDGDQLGIVRPQAASLSDGDIRDRMRRTARHVAPGASGLIFRRDVMAQLFPAPTKGFPFAADAYLSFGAACLTPIVALASPLADYRMQPGGQYLKRMLSPEGLRRQLLFQDTVTGHFGLQAASRRNSHFARNRFASAMYDGPWRRRLLEYRRLVTAVLTDANFGLRQRVVMVGFWTLTLLCGPRTFPKLWGWFQRRQTGWHLMSTSATHA